MQAPIEAPAQALPPSAANDRTSNESSRRAKSAPASVGSGTVWKHLDEIVPFSRGENLTDKALTDEADANTEGSDEGDRPPSSMLAMPRPPPPEEREARKEAHKERRAVVSIQSKVRSNEAQKNLQESKEAATMLQSTMRGKEAREQLRRQNDAATLIQSRSRGKRARQEREVAQPLGMATSAADQVPCPPTFHDEQVPMPPPSVAIPASRRHRTFSAAPRPSFMRGQMACLRPASALLKRMEHASYQWSSEGTFIGGRVLHVSQLPSSPHVRGTSSGWTGNRPSPYDDPPSGCTTYGCDAADAIAGAATAAAHALARAELSSSQSSRSLPELSRSNGRRSRPLTAAAVIGSRRTHTPQPSTRQHRTLLRQKTLVEYRLGEPLSHFPFVKDHAKCSLTAASPTKSLSTLLQLSAEVQRPTPTIRAAIRSIGPLMRASSPELVASGGQAALSPRSPRASHSPPPDGTRSPSPGTTHRPLTPPPRYLELLQVSTPASPDRSRPGTAGPWHRHRGGGGGGFGGGGGGGLHPRRDGGSEMRSPVPRLVDGGLEIRVPVPTRAVAGAVVSQTEDLDAPFTSPASQPRFKSFLPIEPATGEDVSTFDDVGADGTRGSSRPEDGVKAWTLQPGSDNFSPEDGKRGVNYGTIDLDEEYAQPPPPLDTSKWVRRTPRPVVVLLEDLLLPTSVMQRAAALRNEAM